MSVRSSYFSYFCLLHFLEINIVTFLAESSFTFCYCSYISFYPLQVVDVLRNHYPSRLGALYIFNTGQRREIFSHHAPMLHKAALVLFSSRQSLIMNTGLFLQRIYLLSCFLFRRRCCFPDHMGSSRLSSLG